MLRMLVKGGKQIDKWARERAKAARKAMSLALSKEAYRLMEEGGLGLKKGELGLEERKPTMKGFANRNKSLNPLTGLSQGITYYVNRKSLKMEVGFRGRSSGTKWQAKIARKSVKGYRIPISKERREWLHEVGIHLRKTTKSIPVPARDIMSAIQDKYGKDVVKNIDDLFSRKMRGERI